MRTRNNLSHAAFLLGPTGKIATWNAACQRMLGYPGEAVLLQPITGILGEATRKVLQELLKHRRGDAEELDADIILADGSVAPFKLIFIPQFRQSGKFFNYSVMIEPTGAPGSAPATRRTGRDMAEPDRIGATPLKDFVNFLAGAFYVINQSGRMVMWNTGVEQATQMTRNELAAIAALELFANDQRKRVGDAINDVFMHDGKMLVEADLLAKSGKARPYIFSGARFEAGGHFYLCGMGLEISDLRKQGEQLRLRERALHASSNGIVITLCLGKNNPVEYVNPAFERITGYRAEEVIERDMRFLAAPGLDEAERTLLRAAIIERREINVVFRNMRKNGEVFWNDLTVTPVLDEAGTATHFIGVINDVTVSMRRTSYLEHELNHDVLTGLASRNLLWDRLDQALHVAQRNKTLVATVLVDLDNFKDINDTFGHDGGDEVLRVVARRLQGAVRESDTVARLGGDEFVLILENQPSLRFTLRMIERVRQDMSKAVVIQNKEIDVRTSMGVSIFPHDASSSVEMIQAADVAMYHAKAAGRNDVHFFSPEMKASNEAKHKLETSMRSAIAKEEMFLEFQPRICLKTGKIIGAEALLRWRHPEQGVLLPASFITEAEENGLIISFGEWVFSNICMILQRLKLLGFHNLVMSMNVSFRELSQKNYVELIGKKLRELKLPPGVLELEIREAALMRNPQLAKEIFSDIKKVGIKLAIDEFGAGVSSLSELQKLAVNHLKIPRSFIDSINQQSADGVMAKTMIGIGHSMNFNVIAEGVETSLQMNFLKQNDCDEMQGNYFSQPVGMQAFEQMLLKPGR